MQIKVYGSMQLCDKVEGCEEEKHRVKENPKRYLVRLALEKRTPEGSWGKIDD